MDHKCNPWGKMGKYREIAENKYKKVFPFVYNKSYYFTLSKISIFHVLFHRRRYKVVAEQYCKISPPFCIVCLFFKLL